MTHSADTTTACLLRLASQRFTGECAMISEHEQLTFAELEQQVCRVASYFERQGIEPGDRAMVVLDNEPSTVVIVLALIRLRVWCCPVNPQFPLVQLRDIKASIEAQWVIRRSALDDDRLSLSSIDKARKREVMSLCSAANLAPVEYENNTPCCLILTSGTSGSPKAAAFSYQQLYLSALGANDLIPLAVGDRNLMSLPLFHVGGLAIVFRCLLGGATMILSRKRDVLDSLELYRVTHASMVATQLRRVLKRMKFCASESKQTKPSLLIKAVLVGGGPVAPQLLDEAEAIGLPCWLTYGLTEMSSQVYTQSPHDKGHVLNYRELRVSDQNEILVRGETLFMGYYQQGKLRLPLNSEGWFETKDLGRYVSGRLDVIGRKDNQFICGGENIQPEEIEAYVNKVNGVVQSIVVPIPDAEFGLRPVIFIECAEPISIFKLKRILKNTLPSFKIPVAVLPWVESEGLKVSRSHLESVARLSDFLV